MYSIQYYNDGFKLFYTIIILCLHRIEIYRFVYDNHRTFVGDLVGDLVGDIVVNN